MASEIAGDPVVNNKTVNVTKPTRPPRHVQLKKLYALPVPLRTYPLPTFIPHNPLSLFHILYTWISQTLSPPSSHPQDLYQGWFIPESQSVHISEEKTIRALWEEGFFGKGSLSRSEPSWLEREKRRRGDSGTETSEEYTSKRRAERQQVKWERARKEREAIDQKLEEERKALEPKNGQLVLERKDLILDSQDLQPSIAEANGLDLEMKKLLPERDGKPIQASQHRTTSAPVGPTELLLLPNSHRELLDKSGESVQEIDDFDYEEEDLENTIGELELLMAEAMKGTDDADDRLQQLEELVSGLMSGLPAQLQSGDVSDSKDHAHQMVKGIGQADVEETAHDELLNGFADINGTNGLTRGTDATILIGSTETNGKIGQPSQLRSAKSVRFSPTVEETTFIRTSPPSPDFMPSKADEMKQVAVGITDQEHLQLSLEEAFFLSYGLGIFKVMNPSTQQPLSNIDLLRLCRMYSYFPPQTNFTPSPDDPFMLSYIVYHHFRSLGWVVRGGIKFSVDFLLYNRGPVFSHAEFAIIILPSYTHPYWSENEAIRKHVAAKEKRDWHWLHCINRVNTQVKKTLVLVYVDIPPPIDGKTEQELGIHGVFRRYGIREVVMKRWLYNRSRA